MSTVLLLRTPPDSSPDPYDAVFRNATYSPYSVPVLQSSFTDLSKLQNLITAGPHYAGVILTSKRSCEAWITAVKNCITLSSSDNEMTRTRLKLSLAAWTKTPFYVVGKGTAAALRELQTTCLDLGMDPFTLDIRGEESGSGEHLAQFILGELEHADPDETKPLLYLTGDKNRDTVPTIFSKSRIQLDAMQVYETHAASDFEDNLNSIIQETRHRDIRDWWIVFFAPSSSTFVYPVLQKYFHFTRHESDEDRHQVSDRIAAHVAAIGHTTSSFLEDHLGIHVHVVAEKPTPVALLAAIAANTSQS